MEPDLELVRVREDQSFKIWSHGLPYRTVRWHFHPEYELHLVTSTDGDRYVGDDIGRFAVGDLVFVGPNLPHNWISDLPAGEMVAERCLVLQFTGEFIAGCMGLLPELRFLDALLAESFRGVQFDPAVSDRARPLMIELIDAGGARRIALFVELLDVIGRGGSRRPLASPGFRADASGYMSNAMNAVLQHIGSTFTGDLCEADLARRNNQSVSGFSRAFRRHTGTTFVQYVNALRLELACQHLTQDDLSITEICYEVGFNNVSNFNRQFLAAKAMPPSKFRALYRSGTRLRSAA